MVKKKKKKRKERRKKETHRGLCRKKKVKVHWTKILATCIYFFNVIFYFVREREREREREIISAYYLFTTIITDG
jgi:hypothetical protein